MKDFSQINNEISYLIRTRQFSTAMAHINDALAENYDPYLLVFKAHILIVTSDSNDEILEEAKSILNGVLEDISISFPTRKYALSELGRIANIKHDEVKALDYYQQILDLSNYVEPTVRCKMSSLYCSIGMYDRALDVLDVPDFNIASMNNRRCQVYLQKKEYENALKALESPIIIGNHKKDALDINPIRVENEKNYFLGCIYHSAYNKFDTAIKYFELACKDNDMNDQTYWAAITGLISTHFCKQSYEKCREYCQYYLDRGPKTSKNYSRVIKPYIRSYIETRNFDKALELAKMYEVKNYEIYINACLKLNKFEFIEAYELLNQIDTKDEGLDIEVLYRKLIIFFRLNRVKEFDKLYHDLILESSKSKFIQIEAKCMKILLYKKNHCSVNLGLDTYYTDQIKSFDESRTREYIKSNFKSKFHPNIDIDELMNYIKNQIEVATPMCDGLYDLYIINYRNVGLVDGSIIHSVIVKCLPDTKDIILVLPNDAGKLEHESFEVTSKRPKLSQIDKFNRRYGKK